MSEAIPGGDSPEPLPWRPIEDLPGGAALTNPEVAALAKVWRDKKDSIRDRDLIQRFNEKLCRQWSIETGLLERVYTLDRGTTQTLIEQGIDASLIAHGATNLPPEQLVEILADHMEAVDGIRAFVQGARQLSTAYIRELHQVLLRHQEDAEAVNGLGRRVRVRLVKGDWKKLPNNPGNPATQAVVHFYCPPEQVSSEMDKLIELHLTHGEVPPETEAAWLHHRFTQIHPFQDGNGRVARALATLVFLKAGWFPLVVTNDGRADYIAALQAADHGDLAPLIRFFTGIEKSAFLRALGLGQEVLDEARGIKLIIQDAAKRIRAAFHHKLEDVHQARDELVSAAKSRLDQVAGLLIDEIDSEAFEARVFVSEKKNDYWFGAQIVEIASHFDYHANLADHKAWVHLRLRHGWTTSLVIAFHHLGRLARGVMVATAFVRVRETRPLDEGEERSILLEPACREVFTFAAGRSRDELRQSFLAWLEEAIQLGLETWRRRL